MREAVTGPGSRRLQRLYFDTVDEIDELDSFHHVLGNLTRDAYNTAAAKISKTADWESGYDGGDLHDDAISQIGIDPYNVSLHVGLMVVSRAVTVLETLTVEVMEAILSGPVDELVYPNGKQWTHDMADDLYWRVLLRPLRPWSGESMKAIARLRNLYVHAYGVHRFVEDAEDLAALLHKVTRADRGPTPDEAGLGLHGDATFFDLDTTYHPKEGLRGGFGVGPEIQMVLSPLATHRLLGLIRQRAIEILDASSYGTVKDLTERIDQWVAKHLDRNKAADAAAASEAPSPGTA
ncbi:hypothetical protein DEJ03_03670 [Curtobacterium sp. MCLR17_043]|nr:hypothetical protein DEJ03_03670 [Curtobacterium sp. MCLR17_043]